MAEQLTLEIDQGEDWTTDMVFTNDYSEPLAVVHPCRLDIKAATGGLLYTLETNPDLPDGEIPTINLSTEIGLLQLHIEDTVTALFPPGDYFYDLFITVDDGSSGPQRLRPLYGQCLVSKRITAMV